MNLDYLDMLYLDLEDIGDGTITELVIDLVDELLERGYDLKDILDTIELDLDVLR